MSSTRPDLLAGQQFPPPPKQARSRQKRNALLQAALILFAERGYEETTIEEIAHRADVAVGGFYQHFASKRQILLVLMDRLLDDIGSLTVEAGPAGFQNARDLIEQTVRRGLQVDWSYAGAYRAWREAAAQDRELRALALQIEQWSASLLEQMLVAMLQLPGARRDVDSAMLAAEINLLFLQLSSIPPTEQTMIERTIDGLTHLIYHALFTDEA